MIVTKYLLIYHLERDKNLLINTLSGAADVVDDQICYKLENKEIPKNEKIVQQLVNRYYIFKDEKEEQKYFRNNEKFLHYINEKQSRNLSFTICPTYGCNLRCTYCFQDHTMHSNYAIMTEKQVDKAFEVLEKSLMKKLKKERYTVTLFGGEPLQKDTENIVRYIIEKAIAKNHGIHIITNGIYIEKFLDVFNKYKNYMSFQITLDGTHEMHDKRRIGKKGEPTFKLITSNIDKLLRNGFNVVLRINVDFENGKSLIKLFDFFEEKEWVKYKGYSVQIAPVTSHGGNRPVCANASEYEISKIVFENLPDIKIMKEKYHAILTPDMFRIVGYMNKITNSEMSKISPSTPSLYYCEAAYLGKILVGPDGYMYTCSEAAGLKEYSVGKYYPNLELNEDMIEQWKNRTIFKIDKCSKCNIATLCGGGCSFAALKANGKVDSPFCGETRKVIDNYMKDNKKRILSFVNG